MSVPACNSATKGPSKVNLAFQKRLLDPEYARHYRDQCRERSRKYNAKHRSRMDQERMSQAISSMLVTLRGRTEFAPALQETHQVDLILSKCMDTLRLEVEPGLSVWTLVKPSRRIKTICVAVLYHVLNVSGLLEGPSVDTFIEACGLHYSSFKLVYDEINDVVGGNYQRYKARLSSGVASDVTSDIDNEESKARAAGKNDSLFETTEFDYAMEPKNKTDSPPWRVVFDNGNKNPTVLCLDSHMAEALLKLVSTMMASHR